MILRKSFFFFFFLFFSFNLKAEVIVSSASSLQAVMLAITEHYSKQNSQKIIINSTSSGILARQIIAGATINIFISANKEWVDFLQKKNLLAKNRKYELVYNQLVLAKNCASPKENLRQARKIAVGDFAYVPAGRYTKNYLEHTGQLEIVKPKLVFTNSEHQAVLYIQKKFLDMAFIYSSSLKTYANLCLVQKISSNLLENIVYQMVLVDSFVNHETLQFVNFLRSPTSLALFQKYGFLSTAKE